MKHTPCSVLCSVRKLVIPCCCFGFIGFNTASADSLTWGGTSGSGGVGIWNSSNTNWNDGAAATAWVDGSAAVFTGVAGTVSLSGSVNVESLSFGIKGYQINGGAIAIAPSGLVVDLSALVDGTTTVRSSLVGSGGVSVTGSQNGTFDIGGVNTFSGGFTAMGINVAVSNSNALGSGPVVIRSNNVGQNYLRLAAVSVTNSNLTLDSGSGRRTGLQSSGMGASVWGGAGNVALTGSANIEFTNQNANSWLEVKGNVDGSLSAGSSLMLRGASHRNILGGVVSIGSTGLIKTDAGTWTIESTGNQWGATVIENGTLRTGATNALPTGTMVTLGVGGASTLDIGGFNQSVAGLTKGAMSATVTNGGTADAILETTGSSNYSGVLSDGATNKLALMVADGQITLSGTNTYSGGTEVASGASLGADSAFALGAGNVTIRNGGRLSLFTTGVGTIILGEFANFVLEDNAELSMTLAADGYSDRISGFGMAMLSGTLLLHGVIDYTSVYTLFEGFSSISVVSLNIVGYDDDMYRAVLNESGALSFSAVPEPSAFALAFAAVALLVAGIRRRNRR